MESYLDERARLGGRVAAVIGGGGGIGAAISLALARCGVGLALLDRNAAMLEETAARVRALGCEVEAVVGEASDPGVLDLFYDGISGSLPRLDILVNLAGGTRRCAFADTRRDDHAREIQLNYGYIIQSCQRALPLLRASGCGGSIINFTTIEAHRGAAGFAVYAGAKAATQNFSRALAVEIAAEKIRVNCIAPDTTPSKGNADAMPPEVAAGYASLSPEAIAKGLAMYVPLKVAPPAEALADAVLFLAGDLSAFITGTTIHVDGGTMAASGFLDWPHGDGFVPVPLAGSLTKLFNDETPIEGSSL